MNCLCVGCYLMLLMFLQELHLLNLVYSRYDDISTVVIDVKRDCWLDIHDEIVMINVKQDWWLYIYGVRSHWYGDALHYIFCLITVKIRCSLIGRWCMDHRQKYYLLLCSFSTVTKLNKHAPYSIWHGAINPNKKIPLIYDHKDI